MFSGKTSVVMVTTGNSVFLLRIETKHDIMDHDWSYLMIDFFKDLWYEFSIRLIPGEGLQASLTIMLTLVGIAAILAFIPFIWRITSYFITVVHEGGHALAGILVGRRVTGIKIRWDRSGETESLGSGFLPFRIWTTWWGYPTPAVLGAVYLWAASEGYQGIAITITLVMSVIMFISIRSLIAFLSITVTLICVWAAWWFLPPATIALILYAVGWFLIFGGINGMINLSKLHWLGDTANSDAKHLQKMTLIIPSIVWLITFWVATLVSLASALKHFV